MAKIPLRAYNREIESYIEQGRTEEAIAHCRHILKFYPKHLDTYRLLGKAFLESQRYGEAADILQRVLSAVPDDFISQIGMSIIREDEGNLDAAIFHMERAHEIQPSNTAIQEELRRLYGRRDGVEPPKVRLTRGALVRLYARGDLYPQAIAEIRAALAENPNRVDLEVILARMYYLTGQKVEAAEVCSKLVARLPYCFEANRILADVLPGTSRAEDARIYQQRVFALDPYLEFISPTTPVTTDVPDHTVALDHLEYDADTAEAQSPGWAQTLGVDWSETDDQLPDWMAAKQPQAAPPEETPAAHEEHPTGEEPGGDQPPAGEPVIPAFMATAGWLVSEGDEQPPEEISPLAEDGEEEIAPAEIPDWLRSMAPEPETESAEDDDQAAKWLESILPAGEQEDQEVDFSELTLPDGFKPLDSLLEDEPQAESEQELPATLPSEFVSETQAGEGDDEIDTGELPDWLTGIEIGDASDYTEQIQASEPEWMEKTESPAEGTTEAEADWLAALTEGDSATHDFKVDSAAVPADDLPDWLRDASQALDRESEEPASAALPIEEVNSIQDTDEAAQQPEAGTEMPPLEDLDATMAWLENLAARQGAEEETLTAQPDERVETPPDWIASLQLDEETAAGTEADEPAAGANASPEWITDDVTTAAESEVEAVIEQEEAPAAEEPVSLDEAEIEDSFAWLEGLAARQGAQDGTLLTDAEDRPAAAPEWISEISQMDETVRETASADENEAEIEPSNDLPDWLTEALAEEKAEPEAQSAADPADETGEISPVSAWATEIETEETTEPPADSWVEAAEKEEPVPIVTDEAQAAVLSVPKEIEAEEEHPEATDMPAAAVDETIPEWLQDLVDEDLTPELTEAKALDDMPEWLEKFDTPRTAEEPPVEPEPEFTEPAAEAIPVESPVVEPASARDWESLLQAAQADLAKENVDSALERYASLIESGTCLDETIQDLRDALYRYPVDVSLWQMLGDAYARNNMLQDALDAYTKAEELLG